MKLIEFIENNMFGYNEQANEFGHLPLFNFEKDFYNFISNHRYVLVKKSRLMHFTTMLAGYTAWKLLFSEKNNIFYFSNKILFGNNFKDRVKLILRNFINLEEIKEYHHSITLPNGNSLIFGVDIHNLQGLANIKDILIDEAGFIKDLEKKLGSIIPNLASNNTKLIIGSTVSKNKSYFNELYLDDDNIFEKYELHYKNNPLMTDERINEIKISLSEEDFQVEYENKILNKKKNKTNLIQFRVDEDLAYQIGLKLIEKNITLSEYMRNLIIQDIT